MTDLEKAERAAILRVARVMREEAARLPRCSHVAACYEESAEESLRLLDDQHGEPQPLAA